MPRALWKGAINFGLISIPVKMYKAASSKDLHFRELHDADEAPLKQKRVCSVDGKEVPYENVVKGFEISKNHFVVLKREELEALEQKLPQSIDIENFVDEREVDPLYYKASYYLAPDRGSNKAYALLITAMKESGRAAVARLTLRMREHVAVFRPTGRALVLSLLFYADEVVEQDSLTELPEEITADKRELSIAVQIIDSLTAEFDPQKYRNVHKEKVLELIERKADGEDISDMPEQRKPAKVVDLMAALQASLEATHSPKGPASESEPSKTKTAKKKAAGEKGKRRKAA